MSTWMAKAWHLSRSSIWHVCGGVSSKNEKFDYVSTSAIVPTTASSPNTLSVSFTFTWSSSSNQSATATRSSATSSNATGSQNSKPLFLAGTSAGVGAGSVIGVLAIADMCYFCFRRQAIVSTKQGYGRTEPWSANAATTSVSGTGGVGQPYEIGGDAIGNDRGAGADSEIHEIANQRILGS